MKKIIATTKNTSTEAKKILDKAELLFDKNYVEKAVSSMARSITVELSNSDPIVLPIMNGGLILGGMLIPQLDFPLQIDYVHATRYRGGTSGNKLCWLKRPEKILKGRILLLIDDILDEGITLSEVVKYCYDAGAKKVLTAVLAEKKMHDEKPFQCADFTALQVPDRYVFGYGMDYREYHRNLMGIYAI